MCACAQASQAAAAAVTTRSYYISSRRGNDRSRRAQAAFVQWLKSWRYTSKYNTLLSGPPAGGARYHSTHQRAHKPRWIDERRSAHVVTSIQRTYQTRYKYRLFFFKCREMKRKTKYTLIIVLYGCLYRYLVHERRIPNPENRLPRLTLSLHIFTSGEGKFKVGIR